MMTDNEILKALECCANEQGCENCPANPHRGNYGFCTPPLIRAAFDLITRQRAEIEDLQAEIDKQYEQAKADILGNMADGGTSCHWCIEQHKAEAIKEFAESLKAKINIDLSCGADSANYLDYDLPKYIDILVQEMAGGENGLCEMDQDYNGYV